jgi:hypothetical protein
VKVAVYGRIAGAKLRGLVPPAYREGVAEAGARVVAYRRSHWTDESAAPGRRSGPLVDRPAAAQYGGARPATRGGAPLGRRPDHPPPARQTPE